MTGAPWKRHVTSHSGIKRGFAGDSIDDIARIIQVRYAAEVPVLRPKG